MSDNELRSKIPKDIAQLLSPEFDIVIRHIGGIHMIDWALLKNAEALKKLTSSREITQNYELVLMPKAMAATAKAST